MAFSPPIFPSSHPCHSSHDPARFLYSPLTSLPSSISPPPSTPRAPFPSLSPYASLVHGRVVAALMAGLLPLHKAGELLPAVSVGTFIIARVLQPSPSRCLHYLQQACHSLPYQQLHPIRPVCLHILSHPLHTCTHCLRLTRLGRVQQWKVGRVMLAAGHFKCP
ncbi:unnamed protein product, partial [Closterium sp. Naga37s-1]